MVRVFSAGRADRTSWYSLWEAVEAIFSVCGRDGKAGSFRGLGE